jgi:hypothetical protein
MVVRAAWDAETGLSKFPESVELRQSKIESAKAFPPEFYKLCEDQFCARSVIATFKRLWPKGFIEAPTFERPMV